VAKKPITESERITLERILKRKLTAQEIETRSLSREPAKPTLPTRGMSDEEFVAHVMSQPLRSEFKPIVKNTSDADPFAEVLAEAERAAENERIASLPPAQRHLITVKAAAAEMIRRNTVTAAMAKHLADNAKTLAALRALSEEVQLDPYWTFEDCEAIRNAIAQIEFGPTADEAATATLLGNVDTIKGQRLQLRIEDISARMRDAGLDDAEIAAAIAKRFAPIKPADETPAPSDDNPAWFALHDKSVALHAQYDALKADPKADKAKVREAFNAWLAAGDATDVAKAEYAAANPEPADQTPAPKSAESGAAA
jgi:hypothetical protein